MNSEDGFDVRDFVALEKSFERFRAEFPQQAENFLTKQGTEARTRLIEITNMSTTKKTGNLIKGIHRKPVEIWEDTIQTRVYNKAPHAPLLEHGHELWAWGHATGKDVEGKHMAAYTTKSMKRTFPGDAADFVERQLKKLRK